jgi:GntR family transcriptional repressor for pyruvate dehydrogenase complex
VTATSIGKPVRAPKMAELIATRLRTQVVLGQLVAGQVLPPEGVLMAQYGVSRPTLREAFRILETESLIEVRRGSRGGAHVLAPDLAVAARYVGLLLQVAGTTTSDVHEARTVLEPFCARKLAQRRTPEDLAALRSCIAELQEAISSTPDPHHWSALTYRFHELVLQLSGSNTLAVQGGVLQDIVARHLAVTVSRNFDDPATRQDFRRTVRSYSKLVDLVEQADADGAERHWRSHLQVVARKFRDGAGISQVVDLFT